MTLIRPALTRTALSATIATRAPSRAEVADHQFRGIPKVTSLPPTVTVTNNTAPATTMTAVRSLPGQSYTSIVCDDLTKYRPLGVGSGATRRGASGVQAFACDWLMGTYNPQSPRLEFLFDGPEIEFGVRQFTGAQYHLMVDGEYVTRYPQSLAGTAGDWGNIKVTFGSRAPRRIVLEMYNAGGPWFLGAWMGVNDTMRATAAPTRRLAVMGDSYAGGAYSSPIGTFVTSMSQTLGFRDFINAGAGSTGWLATGGKAKAGDRLAADVLNHAPTDVVLALGHNDTSFTNTSIAAEVTATLTTIRATLPDLRSLVVVGPLFAGSTPGVYTAMNDAMQAASAQADAFIDTVDSPIFTGTGRVGATTGDGNGDLYIGADGAHPTDAGNEWLGHALGQAILDATN